jgi:hypothetical protein
MSRNTRVLIVGSLCAAAMGAQTPMPHSNAVPELRGDLKLERALRELMKQQTPDAAPVCAIPLVSVPVPKELEPMPVRRPPADLDRMTVAMPAPPCPEEKR